MLVQVDASARLTEEIWSVQRSSIKDKSGEEKNVGQRESSGLEIIHPIANWKLKWNEGWI